MSSISGRIPSTVLSLTLACTVAARESEAQGRKVDLTPGGTTCGAATAAGPDNVAGDAEKKDRRWFRSEKDKNGYVFEFWCIDMAFYGLRFLCENGEGGIVNEKWVGVCPYEGGENDAYGRKVNCKKGGGFVWISSWYESKDTGENDDAAAEGGRPKQDSVEFDFDAAKCTLRGKHFDANKVTHMKDWDRDGMGMPNAEIPGDAGGAASSPRSLLDGFPAGGALGFSCCPGGAEQTGFENSPTMNVVLTPTGSARFPGDAGQSVVFTRRRNAAAAPSDDALTLHLLIHNGTGAPLVRRLEICGDRGAVGLPPGQKRLTSLFRPVGGGTLPDPLTIPVGRTILRLEAGSAAARRKIADAVDRAGSVNLPLEVILDVPEADIVRCELESDDHTDFADDLVGLRPRTGAPDDAVADEFFVAQSPTALRDSMHVQLGTLDMPKVPYSVTGLELVGGEFGGAGLPGFDAGELRRADPICPAQPDLSPVGLLSSFGVVDGIGEIPTGPPGTVVTLDTHDVFVDPVARPENLFVLAVTVPGERVDGPITALGGDSSPAHTNLGCSGYELFGVQPSQDFGYANFMLRALLDGEGATLVAPGGIARRPGAVAGAPGVVPIDGFSPIR